LERAVELTRAVPGPFRRSLQARQLNLRAVHRLVSDLLRRRGMGDRVLQEPEEGPGPCSRVDSIQGDGQLKLCRLMLRQEALDLLCRRGGNQLAGLPAELGDVRVRAEGEQAGPAVDKLPERLVVRCPGPVAG
jgi:hypothetical protein